MKILRYQPGQVQPAALPGPYQSANTSVAAFGGQTGQAMEQLGQNMHRAVVQVDNIQSQIAEARAKEADNAFSLAASDLLHAPERGYFTQRGRAAIDSADTVRKSLYDLARQHEDSLDNPEAKRMFRDVTMKRMASFSAQLGDHYHREAVDYNNQQSESRIANLAQEAEDNWTRPSEITTRVNSVRNEIMDLGMRNGWSAELVQNRLRGMESDVHRRVALRMADANPVAAQKYLDDNGPRMFGRDFETASKVVRSATLTGQAQQEADAILMSATGAGAFSDAVAQVESGGNPDAKNPNSSASGPGQFIDSTWLSTVRKHRPDLAGKADAELLALKTNPVLSSQMTDRLAADNARSLAAAGLPSTPGTLYLAHFAGAEGATKVLSAAPDTPVSMILGQAAVKANPFLKDMTAQDLAQWANGKMAGVGGPSGPAPLDSMLARARTIADPQLRDEVEKRIRIGHADMERAAKDRETGARRQAMAYIDRGGTPDDIPTELRNQLEGTGFTEHLWKVVEQRRRGALPEPHNPQWGMLYTMAHENPSGFAKVELEWLRPTVHPQDFDDLLRMQARINNPDEQAKMVQRAVADAMSVGKKQLAAAGFKEKSSSGKEAFALFQAQVGKAVESYVAENKTRPTETETLRIIGGMLTKVTVPGGGFLGLTDTQREVFQVDVPDEDRNAIRAALARRGQDATPDAIAKLYLSMRSATKAPAPAKPPPSSPFLAQPIPPTDQLSQAD